METLRTSFMQDGNKIELIFDAAHDVYRIGTRWFWLAKFKSVYDACDAFEALELTKAPATTRIGRIFQAEIRRVPRHRFGSNRNTHSRIIYLVNSVERRLAGLQPQRCGSKGAIERWIPKPAINKSLSNSPTNQE